MKQKKIITKVKIKKASKSFIKKLYDMGITDEKINRDYKKFLKANLMNDNKFRCIAKYIEAIEEILQVILCDDKLKVINCIPQKSLTEAITHGVILDCECRIGTGEIVNIEIQNSFSDDPFYRMSYNQSIIRVENAPKNKYFRAQDLVKIISIMFCSKNVIKNNKVVSELVLKEKDGNKIFDNGIKQYYVNVNAKTKNKKLSELLKIFTTSDYINEKLFPNLISAKAIRRHNSHSIACSISHPFISLRIRIVCSSSKIFLCKIKNYLQRKVIICYYMVKN